MKQIWEIFKLDMKNIGTNWGVLILIGGLAILPSLYAWFNIEANWDPYGQTEEIPIGVVNEDDGATVRGEDIDVGKDLVESLEDNDQMDWQFTDREKAMKEVEYGNYFAVIIIPEDFSEKLGTVASGDPEKAEINYYVNEKINAITPKITDKGVSVIVDDVSSEFTSTVNGVIFDMFNDIGLELEEELPDIQQFRDYVFTLEESLPDIHDTLSETDDDATEAKDIIHDVLGKIPETEEEVENGLSTINSTLSQVEEAEDKFNEISPKIKEDLKKAQNVIHEVNDVLDEVDDSDSVQDLIDDRMDKTHDDLDSTISQLKELDELLGKVETQIEEDNISKEDIEKEIEERSNEANDGNEEDNENDENEENDENNQSEENVPQDVDIPEVSTEDVTEAQDRVQDLIEVLETMDDNLDELDDVGDEADETFQEVREIGKASGDKVDEFADEYNNNIEPTISGTLSDVKEQLNSAKDLVLEIQDLIPRVESLLNKTEGDIDDGQEMLQSALGEFPYVQEKVKETADKIRDIEEETDLEDIIELLKNDPDAEQGFFEEPVKLNENKLFPIENYGTGMTPFYTVLAIWVGGLLLISLLSTDLPEHTYTPKQMYTGRLFTFLTIGLLQTLVVTLGDLFILGVDAHNPVWFVLFGLGISVAFMTLIYTIVSILGDVGKAGVIVLLVLQIAGSGGTYPVVLLPPFFQKINPFLPFTYAVDLMREAVGGIIWSKVLTGGLFLGGVALAFLLIGLFLKKPLNKILNKLMASKGSRLFH